jgi:hypothetical protein
LRQFSASSRDFSRHASQVGIIAWQHITGSGGFVQSTWLFGGDSVPMSSEAALSLSLQQDIIAKLSAAKKIDFSSIVANHGSSG